MTEIENFAVVTYRVPIERISAHLPDLYEVDEFDGPEGAFGFVSTTSFCNRDFRPLGINHPRHSFDECTYRTYVSLNGQRGVYFFGRYLGSPIAWLPQRAIARDTYQADFQVDAQVNSGRYPAYVSNIESAAGTTSFSIRALQDPVPKEPFDSGYGMEQFLTYRLHGFFTSSAGPQADVPVSHPRMRAVAGTLLNGRFDLWEKLGVLTPDEMKEPYSVLLVQNVPFRLHLPRPVV